MITAQNAARIRQNAMLQMARRIVNERPVIELPEVEPENPSKWVVLEDQTICPAGGGITRISAGTVVDDIGQMMTFAQNGVGLAAIA